MKRMRCLLAAFCLLAAAAAASAQGFYVVFIEGQAQASARGSAWTDLAVGSTVAPAASIRIPAQALIQLRGASGDIALVRPGTYAMRDVVAARSSVFVGGAGMIASDESRSIAFGSPQGFVMGAQSAEAPDAKDNSKPGGAGTLTVEALTEEGREFLRSGQFANAAGKLKQALGSASQVQAPEIRCCLAYAYSLDGKPAEAWKQADGLTPGNSDPWAADFILLRARLLLDTSSYGDAVASLAAASNTLSGDAKRAPLFFYLSGLGYRGAGQAEKAVQAFTQAA
jgi:tetratricopeptide (TPR) repeat protein